MSRPKKDPTIRQNEFTNAAKQLFFSKGYGATSIQDILDAVGKKSVSPSVFYYYFSSKEDIYRTVMGNYIREYIKKLECCLQDKSLKIEDRFAGMLLIFMNTLTESKPGIDTSGSMSNRLFALDLREKISHQIADIWETVIADIPWHNYSGTQARTLALYVTGGICEMVYNLVFEQDTQKPDMKTFAHEIIDFTAAVLDIPKPIRRRFIAKIDDAL